MRSLFSAKFNFYNIIVINLFHHQRHIYTRITQFETSMMSNMKTTHLQNINQSIYKLFQQLTKTKEIQYLREIFHSGGFEIRMAGGAVRDLLSNIVPHDIDFATNAKPEEMIDLMQDKPNIRLITTLSGKRHGTVTARINNIIQYEITTLRIDNVTNGRYAEVEFIKDWKLDASRRDLTINSMFIDLNGILYDFFDGESDLKKRCIRFVGDPEKRIKEDYLRILRYFRFYTLFGDSGSHDTKAISAIKNNIDGIKTISAERIWSEMKRILSNINCINTINTMFKELNFGKYIGFTSQLIDLNEFYKVQNNLARLPPEFASSWKPETLFASLIKDIEELTSIVYRLKLSNLERDGISYILINRKENLSEKILKKHLVLEPNQTNLRNFIIQYLMYMGADSDQIHHFKQWEIPKFPFDGTMLPSKIKRKNFGKILARLKIEWWRNDYSMSEDQFQEQLEKILFELDNKKK